MTPDNNRQSVFVFPAERREAVSDQSGRWIGSLQLPVSTGQQTAAPPCSRQVQGEHGQAKPNAYALQSAHVHAVHAPYANP